MDPKFHPAIKAIKAGDLDGLSLLIKQDPSLAVARSKTSHPTLLQCLTLVALNVSNKVEMAEVLLDAGADLNGALGAAASINNVEIAKLVLDRGAAINGTSGWSPLEEAMYWNNQGMIELLLERGASVHNLRIASGLGRIDLIESFFNSDGSLKPEAGQIDWPFGDVQECSLNQGIREELQAKVAQWTGKHQDIINNAFIYACMHNQVDAARLLLKKGVEINTVPPGFDYSGTGLHYAALNGHRAMVDFLIEQGADVNARDTKVHSKPSGWADYGGHAALKAHLERLETPANTENI